MLRLFLDIRKAFYGFDQTTCILLDQLKNYGIRGVLLAWCCSYLADCKQYVMIKIVHLSIKLLNMEYPRGLLETYIQCLHTPSL